ALQTVSRLCLALLSMTASRAPKSPERACYKCLSRERESSAVMLFLLLVTTTRASASSCVTHGELRGARKAISQCPTPTCSPTIFRTIFGRFAWSINRLTPFNTMPKYWMINSRSQGGVGPDVSPDGMTYWVSDEQPLTDIKNWRKVTTAKFQKLLVAAADRFPKYDQAENEKQSHVTILVHGYNQTFAKAAAFYENLCGKLFDGPD